MGPIMGIRIGTSGFSYEHWEGGVFYPADLARAKQLEYYCGRFGTVELNVTFYRLPAMSTFEGWGRRTPDDFQFAIKGSRFITHVKRLKDPREPLRLLLGHARPLLPKIACILWQLPPGFHLDLPRLAAFVALLRKVRGPRHAFEFRHESWLAPQVFALLRDAGMTVCRADHPRFGVEIPEETPFEYVRRHGPHEGALYAGCYSEEELRQDAALIRRWREAGKDVFVYFNNDWQGYAVRNAMRLKEILE
jgi:uncharacterized protein YecE (DUF72 family)